MDGRRSTLGQQLRPFALLVLSCIAASQAEAVGLSGTITYTGSRGPVSDTQPIVLRISSDPSFDSFSGKAIEPINGAAFAFDVAATGQYYLLYWLDVNDNGQIDQGEPFEVYDSRFSAPGKPITAPQSDVALEFGDSSVSGFGGTATYTGSLGPVSDEHLICICAASDPDLKNVLGCFEVSVNGGRYDVVTMDTSTYYLVGFLDLNANIQRDAGEPYEIYNHRSMPPGDPVVAGPAQTAINFIFGDENLPPVPTPAATVTPTAEATASPSATVPPPACVGDCDGSNDVTVGELIIMVNITLGNAGLAACPAGDADGSGDITVNEIIAAVNAALNGCPG